ncbi:MAG: hypothetical protein AAF718_14110 [Pseudomonadota bacterium]
MKRLDGREPGQKKREVRERVPYGRMGRVNSVNGTAVFLAMENASHVAVQCYNVHRGLWLV